MYKKLGFSLLINTLFKGLSLLIAIYQLRWINVNVGKFELEKYNLSESYTGIISLLAGFGIATIIQKVFTKNENGQVLGDTWKTLNLFRTLSLFLGTLLCIFFSFIRPELDFDLMMLLFFSSFLITLDYSFASLYNVRGESHIFAGTDFFGKIFLFLALFLDGKIWHHDTQNPTFSFLFILIISNLITIFLDQFINKKYIPSGNFEIKILKIHFKAMLFLGISSALLGLVQYFQTPIAKYFSATENEINAYANAFKLTNQAVFAIGTILPQFASSLKQSISLNNFSKQEKVGKITKNLIITTLFLILIYGILTLFSPLYLNFIDPKKLYPESQNLFYILGLFIVSSSISTIVSMLNIFFDDEKFHFLGIIFQVVLTLLLSVILIPFFGIYGSAIVIVSVSFIDAFLIRIPRLFLILNKS